MTLMMKLFLKRFFYFVSVIIVLTISFAIYHVYLRPPFNFPKPTGQFAVGSKMYYWIDTKRKEEWSSNPGNSNRELMIKIWYPAEGRLLEKPLTQYASDFVDYLRKNDKVKYFLGFSRPIYSFAQTNLHLNSSEKHHPVIIFSHGAGGRYDSNSAHCEELASHGCVVVGISHTYDSSVVQFPDGRMVEGRPSVFERYPDAGFVELRKQTEEDLKTLIADSMFVLDKVEELSDEKESFFYQRLDLKNIGMFGQSMGGAVTIQMCRRDPRVKAGVDLDGSLFGDNATEKIEKPLMFMSAGNIAEVFGRKMTKDDRKVFNVNSLIEEGMLKERYLEGYEKISKSVGRDAYIFVLKNAGHLDFTNVALLKEQSYLSQFVMKFVTGKLGWGSIDGFRATEIVNAYLVNFFNKYLKGQASDLLDGEGDMYSEVEVR